MHLVYHDGRVIKFVT